MNTSNTPTGQPTSFWKTFAMMLGGFLALRTVAYLTWSDAERRQWRRNVSRSWKAGYPEI